jgi:hypothetical protein
MAISYWRFGTTYRLRNYHYTLLNSPEEADFIIRVIKSIMKWAGRVAKQQKNSYRVSVGKTVGKKPLENLVKHGTKILKLILE